MWCKIIGPQCLKNPARIIKLGLRFFGSSISRDSSKRQFAALWGNGDHGRLGLGGVESRWRPEVCSALENESLRAISCGGAHTLFLTDNGRVFATGLNDFGQLGVSNDKSFTTEPLEVFGLHKKVVHISAGYYHSSAITVDGELYVWGNNSDGQLGLGKRSPKAVPVPSLVECLIGLTVKTAALGSEHSVAVTVEGEVLSWGGGGMGRLGHGHNNSSILGFFKSTSEFTPRLIKKLEGIKVKYIAAGLLHTACIDENGSIIIFGEGTTTLSNFGQGSNAAILPMISGLPFSEEVAIGGYHTCVVTNGGELYTWGSNENGCLGLGCTEGIRVPERVEGPFLRSPVCKVSCGWKHTAAISEGNIFTWGWGGSNGTFSEDGQSSGGQLVSLSWKTISRQLNNLSSALMGFHIKRVKEMTLTTSSLQWLNLAGVSGHYKFHVDSIIQGPYSSTLLDFKRPGYRGAQIGCPGRPNIRRPKRMVNEEHFSSQLRLIRMFRWAGS